MKKSTAALLICGSLLVGFVSGLISGVKLGEYEIEELELRLHQEEQAPVWSHSRYYNTGVRPHSRQRPVYMCANHRQYPPRNEPNQNRGRGLERGC